MRRRWAPWLAALILGGCAPRRATPGASASPPCRRGGCSGQLCVPADSPPTMTTCEWRDGYACYRGAECQRQVDGRCGWTMDERLKGCLRRAAP